MFDWFVLVFFFVLCFSHNHKVIGRVSFVFCAIYILFVDGLDGFAGLNGLSGDYFFHMTALLNTCVAYVVYGKYRAFALLSFAFIPLCIIGFKLYDNYYSSVLYDTLAIIITMLQVLLLGARVTTDAITIKGTRGRALVRILNFDSHQENPEISLYKEEASR